MNTRKTITNARIILVYNEDKSFQVTGAPNKKLATVGKEYKIIYNDCPYHSANAYFGYVGSSAGTVFESFYAAKQYLLKHYKEITDAARKRYQDSGMSVNAPFHFTKKSLKITGAFTIYLDSATEQEYFSKEEATKRFKNSIIITAAGTYGKSRICSDMTDRLYFTVIQDHDCLLFEPYFIDYVKSDNPENLRLIPKFKPLDDPAPFIINKELKIVKCCYSDKKKTYIPVENQDYEEISSLFSYRYSNTSWGQGGGYARGLDISKREVDCCNLNGHFTPETKQLLLSFGLPQYFLAGYSDVKELDTIDDLLQAASNESPLYSSSETMICKEITDFCKDIPFDQEHSVVKYKNGYILRLGRIKQGWKQIETDYRGKVIKRIRDSAPSSVQTDEKDEWKEALVYEKFTEYARLFVSNTFSTRSLSFSRDGGHQWHHDGIHLISHLFVQNPVKTKLGIDCEAFNRKALETLYTVHPKLKYMKKYMEKHPDVLYDSNVAFLRALFQYDMILETLISMNKDSMFWEQTTHGRNSYYWNRGGTGTYQKTTEKFSMDEFVSAMLLTKIPQKGDFFQRIGLTKQQFKLIFEDMDQFKDIMTVLNSVFFKVGNITVKRGGWSYEDPIAFKQVSIEDVKRVIEITKELLSSGAYSYSISNDINRLNSYYNGLQRVHKALVVKKYDRTLLDDYLRMRNELIEQKFVDFKESIWDIFPDDNADLQRYHDRIMFIYNEYSAAKDVAQKARRRSYIVPGTTDSWTVNSIYLYYKERGVHLPEIAHVFDVWDNELSSINANTITLKDIMPQLPTSSEEAERISRVLETLRQKYCNLYYMYWETDNISRWWNNSYKREREEQWGGKTYDQFVQYHLGKNLDTNKYDLYLRLRKKFNENMADFKLNDYPHTIESQEELDRLYDLLAAQEPELDRIIEARERERRLRIARENESKVVEQQKKYVERYKKLKSLNYNNGSDRCIVVPENLVSLIVEGQTLHHCVGSFVDSVSEGKDTIVFLRKSAAKEEPYVTVSLQQNGKEWYIDQAHGDRNSDITQEDVAFLKEWGKAKGVIDSSIKIHYGANCHH